MAVNFYFFVIRIYVFAFLHIKVSEIILGEIVTNIVV